MPLIRITAENDSPMLQASPAPLRPALHRALSHPTCGSGPVVVMIHGYRYQPSHPRHCPFTSILSLNTRPGAPRATSWPLHLGFGRTRADQGLAVAFGWQARGTIWQACRSAARAGIALARLVADLRRLAPARPVHLVAHSLGARVALAALDRSAPGDIDKLLLLTGAEYTATALAALQSPAGKTSQVLNITSRENDLFDFIMERLVVAPQPGDQMLGLGQARARNLVTLQLDDPATLSALRTAGYPVASPSGRICHWFAYMRPGVFPLYRAVLSGQLPFADLRAMAAPDPAPRWSRLLPRPGIRFKPLPLPFPAKAS